ncbi:MAG: S8 family serine peptidase [Planctomycetota bacterium]|nr:S8 family serine peptidase [Planctomycetota bacterium]
MRSLPLVLFVLLATGACGGGGGGGFSDEEPEVPAPGLRGTVRLPGMELGRIAELEPNDSPAQPHALAPLFARCSMEVAGLAAANATDLGGLDPDDVFRFGALADQEATLSLDFRRIGTDLVEIGFAVVETESGTPVASDAGTTGPLTATFPLTANTAYDVTVTITAGSASYVLEIALADGSGGTMPLMAPPLAKPAPAPAMPPTQVAAGEPPCACDRVLVQLAADVDVAAFCRAHGLSVQRRLASGTYCLGYPHDGPPDGRRKAVSIAADLCDCEGVVFAEPDWIVQPLGEASDPLYGGQWNLKAIGCEPAWDVTLGDPDIVIGVIDAGILPDHPDLIDNLEPGYDFISDAAIALDGDGRDPDPTDPGDRFLTSGLSSWHGTHVAGICVAQQGNDFGITGVAPGCRVMPLRALGLGGGFVSDVADAVLFGAGLFNAPGRGQLLEPLRILNLSIGLNIDSTELRSACSRAFNRGVFLVGATGNTGGAVVFPARYDSVFAVAAVDARLRATAYSSFGPEVDVAAPGGLSARDIWGRGWPDHILSTVRDETTFPSTYGIGGLQGTSHAAPHVSGAAALLLSMDPTLTSTDLKTILRDTALDVGAPGYDVAHGAGLLQVHQAVKAVIARLGQTRPDPILTMPTHSVLFKGFDTLETIPISNGGGGTLAVTAVQASTDDGVLWLSASLIPAPPGEDTNVSAVDITVDRNGLADGRYSGTIRLANPDGVLAAVRVLLYVDTLPRVGKQLHVAAIEESTGIARRVTPVQPEYGWRFWLTELPAARYLIRAGEDLDEDTFFCEPADACAWFGGPTENDAIPVQVETDEPAIVGLDVFLVPPTGQ